MLLSGKYTQQTSIYMSSVFSCNIIDMYFYLMSNKDIYYHYYYFLLVVTLIQKQAYSGN